MSRKEAGIGFGIMTAVFCVLTSVTAPKQSVDVASKAPSQVSQISNANPEPAKPQPVITSTTEIQAIPYTAKTVQDATIAQGVSTVTTKGTKGVKTLTYEVTKLDGLETGRKLVKEEITTQPVTEVTTVGTKVKVATPPPKSNCDPNYSGPCVPIASDVDCSSGNGNGPAYVRGPVKVIGRDIYDLDRDGNGTGCENG